MLDALKQLIGDRELDLSGARMFRAPGRINLMGDHTDYNGGLVLPAAIDYETRVLCVPDNRVLLRSLDVDGLVDLDPGKARVAGGTWGTYISGVLAELSDLGRRAQGLTGVIDSTVPVGRGLSSSAALEVSFALAACAVADFCLTPMELAEACRRAEERVAGVQCGIMDQAVAMVAKEGTATLLDCQTLEFEQVPIPNWMSVVAIDSGIERSLAGSSYNRRRRECEEALSALQSFMPHVTNLSDIKLSDLDEALSYLDELHGRRLHHVVTENARVRQMADLLIIGKDAPDAEFEEAIGQIFASSQMSLVEEYEAGHPNTNKLVEIAADTEGCLGARQTGAGWGGSVVLLARSDDARRISRTICDAYLEATGKTARALVCTPAQGASEISDFMNQAKPTKGGSE